MLKINFLKRITSLAFLFLALCSLSACKSAPEKINEDAGPGMTIVLEVLPSEALRDMANNQDLSLADNYEYTCQIVARRIDCFGVASCSLEKYPKMDSIKVNVRGFKDTSSLINLLCATAHLDFWLTYPYAGVWPILADIDESSEGSFGKLMRYPMDSQSPCVGMARLSDTAAVNQILLHSIDNKIFDPQSIRFMWGVKPDSADMISLYAIEVTSRDGSSMLDGGCLADANMEEILGGYGVVLKMNSAGAREWKRITGENIGRCIAIVVDGRVYCAPCVNSEIAGGRSLITGNFTADEAKNLAIALKMGKLPVPVRVVKCYVNGR